MATLQQAAPNPDLAYYFGLSLAAQPQYSLPLSVALRRRDVIVFKVLPGASRRLRAARQNRELAGSCRELPHAPGRLAERAENGGKRPVYSTNAALAARSY